MSSISTFKQWKAALKPDIPVAGHTNGCKQAHTRIRWSHTLKPLGTVAPIITDQVHTGGSARAGEAAALICFQFAERPFESERAAAGEVVLLVQANTMFRAEMANTVINVLFTVDACVSSGTKAASNGLKRIS